jgi:hypothetical protein
MKPITITDGVTSFDLLTHRLEKSIRQTHKHLRSECISTSASGNDTTWARWLCLDCKEFWTEELLPAEYERICDDESIP